jgi:hypothetical protein
VLTNLSEECPRVVRLRQLSVHGITPSDPISSEAR